MDHPFADLVGLSIDEVNIEEKFSRCSIAVSNKLMNPHKVVHGAVIYALADTGMGAAVYPGLNEGELCATIEIKINYFHSVRSGSLSCLTRLINRGKSIANLESEIFCGEQLIARANGNYAVFKPSQGKNTS